MGRRGQRTTIQERVVIGERAAAGQADAAIPAVLSCSIWTARKWRRVSCRRQQPCRPGRPSTGSLGTVPVALRAHICQLREGHPGWGAETILGELRADPVWTAERLPSRSRIALFLKEAGLTRRYQRHSPLPQSPATEVVCPHDTWQLDAQGVATVTGVGRTCLVNCIDVASRLKVESFPSVGTTNPPTEDYFLMLRRAFLTLGSRNRTLRRRPGSHPRDSTHLCRLRPDRSGSIGQLRIGERCVSGGLIAAPERNLMV